MSSTISKYASYSCGVSKSVSRLLNLKRRGKQEISSSNLIRPFNGPLGDPHPIHLPPNPNLFLHRQILKRLRRPGPLQQRPPAPRNRTGRLALPEYPLHALGTRAVETRRDEQLHVRVEPALFGADGAFVVLAGQKVGGRGSLDCFLCGRPRGLCGRAGGSRGRPRGPGMF